MQHLDESHPDELFTTKEVAAILKVSMPFLTGHGRRKGPPHIKLGPGTIRYRASAIREYIEKHAVTR